MTMPAWERALYGAALIATPVLGLAEDRISAHVLHLDLPDGDGRQLAILQAIHAADRWWVIDSFVALAWGFVMVAATVGLVKLTRRGAPAFTVATTLVLGVGAVGYCLHAVFWNIFHGSMSRAADLPAMVDFIDQTEAYAPFWAALATVVIFSDLGLVLGALSLWRSRTVPWWAAVCALAFPLNDQFGGDGLPYVLACLLWLVGWGMAGLALVRRRDEQSRAQATPARSKASASVVSAAAFSAPEVP